MDLQLCQFNDFLRLGLLFGVCEMRYFKFRDSGLFQQMLSDKFGNAAAAGGCKGKCTNGDQTYFGQVLQ